MTLKDYAKAYAPDWYTHAVGYFKWEANSIKKAYRDDMTQRIKSVWTYLDERYHGYKSYYLAVAYKQPEESYLMFDGVYFNVPSDEKEWLLKIVKYFLGLPIGCMADIDKLQKYGCVNIYDFEYFVEAYEKGDLIV